MEKGRDKREGKINMNWQTSQSKKKVNHVDEELMVYYFFYYYYYNIIIIIIIVITIIDTFIIIICIFIVSMALSYFAISPDRCFQILLTSLLSSLSLVKTSNTLKTLQLCLYYRSMLVVGGLIS